MTGLKNSFLSLCFLLAPSLLVAGGNPVIGWLDNSCTAVQIGENLAINSPLCIRGPKKNFFGFELEGHLIFYPALHANFLINKESKRVFAHITPKDYAREAEWISSAFSLAFLGKPEQPVLYKSFAEDPVTEQDFFNKEIVLLAYNNHGTKQHQYRVKDIEFYQGAIAYKVNFRGMKPSFGVLGSYSEEGVFKALGIHVSSGFNRKSQISFGIPNDESFQRRLGEMLRFHDQVEKGGDYELSVSKP